ncbi:MAG: hypothetical protein WC657_01130 [Candidatus Paceibacterota bacterium]|jgi:hypothetical protein
MSNISIIAYLIISVSIGYTFAYSSFGEVTKLLDQKQKYENSLAMILSVENKKNELLTEFNAISDADKKNIDTVLPSSLDFVRLVSQIDAVAANYGISIGKISSREVGTSAGASIETTAPTKSYGSSIIQFSFDSSYDNFNKFLTDLEKSLRILDIRSIKLETQDKGVYAYTVEFETYWLK